LLLEFFRSRAGDVAIRHEQEVIHRLDNRHLSAEPHPNAAYLQADYTSANDTHPLGDSSKFERIPGVDNLVAIVPGNGQFNRNGAGRENDVACINYLNV
jgi:hypothetical protein